MTTETDHPRTHLAQLDFDRCYRALSSRDRRFDGQFFVTVHTTGIYCRPSCPAQTPHRQNVDFVLTAAAAQHRGFRACRRCAPDSVPGSPLWNTNADLSSRAMRLITDGLVDRDGVDGLAARLGYSSRHLTRVLAAELGAGPLALARAQRATNARILIQGTDMSMADIAYAAGFASIRQFNDTIREVFATTPTGLRTLRRRTTPVSAPGSLTLRLPFRAPLHLPWLRWFLAGHAAAGVERMRADEADAADVWHYQRTIALPHGPALVAISPGPEHVVATLRHIDLRDLGIAVNRLRRLLDLDADIAAAEESLSGDPQLAPIVGAARGLRVPGCVDPAETLIRTMIGQQISVKAARTHTAGLVAALGDRVEWPDEPDRWSLFPTPATIAERGREVLRGPARRIEAIVAVAGALAAGEVELHAGLETSHLRNQLSALPGIGAWTADYVAMRTTGDPDVLLDRDLVVRHAAGDLGIDLDRARWSPWSSYASMHLWRHRLSGSDPLLTSTIPTSTAPSDPATDHPVPEETS